MSTASLQPSSPPRNVLVIDDDVILREILLAILTAEGYSVHLASSGEEALEFLAGGSPLMDILLLDLHMPGLHGLHLVRQLNSARAPGTLLLGMSASALDPFDAPLFDAFLRKPFGVPEFNHAIRLAEAAAASPSPTPVILPAIPPPATDVLDETIYDRLAAILPPAQLRELYAMTLTDVRRRVDLMRTALDSGNLREYRAEAHAIKGGCGMVGALELSRIAAAVETGSAKDTLPFADFVAACTRLQRMLDPRF